MAAWRAAYEEEGVGNEMVLELAAMVKAPGPDAYATVEVEFRKLMRNDAWTCEGLQTMLDPGGGDADEEAEGGDDAAAGSGEAEGGDTEG